MGAQVVDLVHQAHNLVMAKVKGFLPLCHVVTGRVVVQVHSRSSYSGIPQNAGVQLFVYALAALAQRSTHGCQLFGRFRYAGAKVLYIGCHRTVVFLKRLAVRGGSVTHFAGGIGQPVHITHHGGHLAFKLFRFLGAVRNGNSAGGQGTGHKRQPCRANAAHGLCQVPYTALCLPDRRLQTWVNLARNADRKL